MTSARLSVVLFAPLRLARLRLLQLADQAIREPVPMANRPMGTQD